MVVQHPSFLLLTRHELCGFTWSGLLFHGICKLEKEGCLEEITKDALAVNEKYYLFPSRCSLTL
jgi:hypothetical protein